MEKVDLTYIDNKYHVTEILSVIAPTVSEAVGADVLFKDVVVTHDIDPSLAGSIVLSVFDSRQKPVEFKTFEPLKIDNRNNYIGAIEADEKLVFFGSVRKHKRIMKVEYPDTPNQRYGLEHMNGRIRGANAWMSSMADALKYRFGDIAEETYVEEVLPFWLYRKQLKLNHDFLTTGRSKYLTKGQKMMSTLHQSNGDEYPDVPFNLFENYDAVADWQRAKHRKSTNLRDIYKT